ncbi:MAG TPA: GNAT family N-acetyltransferase [Candidatus Sulfotelmatobacter sp.]|nr:GNAT family N-acetyltransferase [Candidatus Sulfotelmatobacter sp.]
MFSAKATNRIQLRSVDSHDTGNLFGLIDSNRDHLRAWHPWVDAVRTRDDAGRLISAWAQQNADNRGFCAAILFDGQLCGVIHHLNVDWQNRSTALSYWLDAAHQGRGIMTICCRALIVHAFVAWKLNRVAIECAVENVRSRAIPERLGFKLEGTIRAGERLQDRYVDHVVYGLLRSECRFIPDNHAGEKRNHSHPHRQVIHDGRGANRPQSTAFESSLKLAFELHNSGRSEDAEALCRVLEKIHPADSQLLFLLGMILHKKNQDSEAVQYLSLAAQNRPDSARILKGLGCAFQGLKDHARAAGAFERAIELQPQSADNYYNLGKSCYRLEQIERAHALFQRAVEINPRDFNSWNNLGKCLKELNRLDESVEAYDRAAEIAPDYALARYGRAMSLLAAGRFTEGFEEYEWRWRSMTPRKLPQPAWQGENAPGKTLFIHAEQGFGDAIQMARFVRLARERAGHVILECRPELTRLFQYSECADTVISYGPPVPSFDFFIPMLSLPRVLGITRENIPADTPYLRAPARAMLPAAPPPGHLKVGIAWAGNPNHHQDAARSVPLQSLMPVLQIPGVTFYNLQQTVPPPDRVFLETLPNVFSFTFQDFLGTASVIAELDLVISVDTAVAHLAGALGKPAWMLLQHSPDWRWFLDRDDTPWYAQMQLFRQVERNDWTGPIERVAGALRRLADLRNSKHGN